MVERQRKFISLSISSIWLAKSARGTKPTLILVSLWYQVVLSTLGFIGGYLLVCVHSHAKSRDTSAPTHARLQAPAHTRKHERIKLRLYSLSLFCLTMDSFRTILIFRSVYFVCSRLSVLSHRGPCHK